MLNRQTLVKVPEDIDYSEAYRAPFYRQSKLRVLHIGKFYPPHPGGMETHLKALCGELKEAIDVEVIVANGQRQTLEEVVDGVKVTRLGMSFRLGAAPVCPQTIRRIREAQADLVHIHLPNPMAVLAYLASGHRGRLIFTYHSDIVRQKVLGKAFGPILQHTLNRADAIIATSPNYVSSSPVLRKFRERCKVIPFGIQANLFDRVNAFEVSKIRRQYGPHIVLGVGRLVYYKGFEYLIRAMKGVKGHLIIVGNGPLYNELKREAQVCGVSQRVTILTDVKDVHPYYHAADVFALPSVVRSEAFGIVQLEAMACSKPIINTNLDSGVTFASPDGLTGLTVPPVNAGALTQSINTLLNNPKLSAEYGRAGRRRVEQEFNLEVMTRRTLELYSEVMNKVSKRGSEKPS